MSVEATAAALRNALEEARVTRPLRIVGAVNAIAARVATEGGFDGLWVSSLEVSASCGLPDANVLDVRDLVDVVVALRRVSNLPIVVDIDNAGGSVLAAERYAHDLVRAGATALCLEDSRYPKSNSFHAGRVQSLAPIEDVLAWFGRIRDTCGNDLVVIGRTETLIAGDDRRSAMTRAHAYADAGADSVLIHSKDPTGRDVVDIASRWERTTPLAVVPTAFPHWTSSALGRAGFSLCIYANQLTRAAMTGMRAAVAAFAVSETFEPTAGLASVTDVLRVGDEEAQACL